MKLRADLVVGVATHTGRVRSTNEDDYLILAPTSPELERRIGRWFVIADGMGGVTGGSEASRIAVRALVALALREPDLAPEARMRKGFQAACQRVFANSRANAALREMGTTMTAVNLVGRQLVLGHVGDSRCWLLRAGKLTQLTSDHASHSGDHHLTRCIGGGRDQEQVDVTTLALERNDLVVLGTDGLWESMPEPEFVQILRAETPQRAAERLVQRANAGGGQDNATVLLIAYRGTDDPGIAEVVLSSEEAPEALGVAPRVPTLVAPRWPHAVLAVALVLLGIGVAKSWLAWDAVHEAKRMLKLLLG